jgi:hypothetical protein
VGALDAESPVAAAGDAVLWESIEPGIERARFAPDGNAAPDGAITVVRVDPYQWNLSLFSNDSGSSAGNRPVRQWSREEGLVVAVNAGMFATNYLTHIGYMACGGDVNNGRRNAYLSVAAFHPRREGVPPFRIFDLDTTDFDQIRRDYGCMVQNLRLVKRPGENRWPPQDKRWNEVALGEDEEGRVLFIHCRQAFSMHDLIEILLSLPISLVAAQHLEGGPEAQMVLRHGEGGTELVGSWETGFVDSDSRATGWPVPNVIGVTRRSP